MRLLLIKSQKKSNSSPHVSSKKLANTLTPVFQNILTKKCWQEEEKCGAEGKLHLYSALESELPAYSFRVSMEMVPGQGGVLYRSSLLRHSRPMMLSSELRVNLLHKVSRKSLAMENLALEIDSSGQLHLVSRMTYSALLFGSPSQLRREVDARLRALVKASLALLHPILLETNQPSRSAEELRSDRALHLEKVKRHIYFSCYDLGLSEKASEYRHPTEDTLRQREKIIKSLLGVEAKGEVREGRLYGQQEEWGMSNSKEWRREFESTYYFEKLLQVPMPRTTSPNPAENVFIFNEIQIERPEQVAVQDLPAGAGCLKVMAVSAAYLGGQGGEGTQGGQGKERGQFLQKMLVAKIAKGDSGRQRGKLMHERNIVRLFSSAHSGYLLKYYACNQANFPYRNALLMDYQAGTSTLLEHLQLRRDTLSLEGKLTLLAHLSNGLRFLAYYKVVHMDLTLSNVLVYDNCLPKIIDFGEAYHRDTVEATLKTAYSPGFTLPYCAPEIFKNKEFSSAQDMFSFGVIIFRLLLNALPFFPADSLMAVYRAGAHHERFLFAPEGLASVCQEQVCFLLLQLVNLCLRAQEDSRPLPIWTTIILKEILTEIFL